MRIRKIVRVSLLTLLGLLLLVGLSVGPSWLYFHPHVRRTNGIAYGQRSGRELALDILRPSRTNGLGIALMVSGGWKSANAGSFPAWMAAPLLRRGYTVF